MFKIKGKLGSLVGVVAVAIGVLGINGCGNGNEVFKDKVEISSEFRQQLTSLIENKNYEELALETVADKEHNEELKAIYYFASGMKAFNENDNMMNSYFEQIPTEYQDYYMSLYDAEAKEYITQLEQQGIDEAAKYKDLPPVIGATKDQLKTSSWGLPKDVNKTTTENSVSEQWVYGDGKYVYLNDGIVTSIQE